MTITSELDECVIYNNAVIRGEFFDVSTLSWQRMGTLERLVRSLFSKYGSFVDSVDTVCVKRSWQSVAAANEVPEGIAKDINIHFIRSLSKKDYLHHAAHSIGIIYSKQLVKTLEPEPDYPTQVTILPYARLRRFQLCTSPNSGSDWVSDARITEYGRIQLITSSKTWINTFDSLFDSASKLIGRVRFTSDNMSFYEKVRHLFSRERTKIDLYVEGSAMPVVTVKAKGDMSNYVFRSTEDKEPLAVATRGSFGHEWTITLIRPMKLKGLIPYIMLPWALLKESQKSLPSTKVKPYVMEV